MKRFLQLLSYILVAALASGMTLLLFQPKHAAKSSGKLDELTNIIDNYFVADADLEAMENAAANAMVESLDDRWSYYMTADEYLAYKEQMANSYVGIGVSIIQREDGYIDIVKVEANGPAKEAGMLPGDILTAVEGQDIGGMDVDAVKKLVTGEENTQVKITVTRDGSKIDMVITRRLIETIVAQGRMLEGQIGLITISNFDDRCAEETIDTIEELVLQGARGLIFDVRYNPGGYKHELVKLLDYLLPEGPLFRSVDYSGREEVDTSDARFLPLPMVVLVNGDSYSAAEFFAAALSEYGAATLVGEPTTGKGRFQTSFPLSDGSAVVISIGSYCTPNGVDLTDVGLTPDVTVDVDEDTYWAIYYGEVSPWDDPQITAALEVLGNS